MIDAKDLLADQNGKFRNCKAVKKWVKGDQVWNKAPEDMQGVVKVTTT